jgi:glycosyltransferase involved in cell wall biosynthesis
MRVLLVAPTCDPDDVGESWVSAQWVTTLSQRHDVTLLTYSKRDRSSLAHHFPAARVVEWREPRVVGRSERLNSMLKPGYVPFYVKARRWIRAALAAGEQFDLAHQISPVALRYPSPLAGLGLPYLLGPTGGSIAAPPGFSLDEGAWYVRMRRFDELRLAHDRMLRRSYADAACVIGIGGYVRDILGDVPLQRFHAMSDTGIADLPPPVERRRRHGPVRVLFVGRVVRSKGVRNAIRAFALLGDLDVRLDILGEGADLEACRGLVASLDLADRVTLHGRVPRARVDEFYADSEVFLFPSYREPGGLVVGEAMSHGLPAVVCARGGPADTIDDSCGIRVTPDGEAAYEQGLADAVRRLVEDPALRLSLGEGARSRIASIGLWSRKVEVMDRLYADALAVAAPRRDTDREGTA